MELTLDQKRALAIADAKRRAAQAAPPSQPAEMPSVATDVAKGVGSGLVEGLYGIPGMVGDIDKLTARVGGWIGNRARQIAGKPPVDLPDGFGLPGTQELEAMTGFQPYEPKTTAGKFANTAASFVPGAIVLGPAGMYGKTMKTADAVKGSIGNALRYGIIPGVASEAAGQATSGTPVEPYARLAAAIIGGGASAARPPKVPAAPTVDELKTASQALYKSPAVKGLLIDPASFDRAVANIAADVKQAGIDKTLHPDSMAALKRLQEARGVAPTLEELDTLRQIANDARMSINDREVRIASKIVNGIDDYLEKLQPSDVISGDPAAAVDALTAARKLWQRKSKGETIDVMFERAKNAVGANYTQAGFQTAIRQQFRWLADPKYPNRMRGFTPEEKAAVLKVVRGGPVENLLRLIGRGAVRGPGTGSLAAATTYVGGPIVGGAYVVGTEAAKRVAQRIGTRNAELVDALVRGGPGTTPLPSAMRQMPGLSLYYVGRSSPNPELSAPR